MVFKQKVVVLDIKNKTLQTRLSVETNHSNKTVCNRSDLGVWSSSDPGSLTYNPGMKNLLGELRTRRVLRVVTVIEPPFMIVSNNTTSKEVVIR